jgi:hypothetical protein
VPACRVNLLTPSSVQKSKPHEHLALNTTVIPAGAKEEIFSNVKKKMWWVGDQNKIKYKNTKINVTVKIEAIIPPKHWYPSSRLCVTDDRTLESHGLENLRTCGCYFVRIFDVVHVERSTRKVISVPVHEISFAATLKIKTNFVGNFVHNPCVL